MSQFYVRDNLGNFRALPAQNTPSPQSVPVASVSPQVGPLRAYYDDLASGKIPPENMRIESLEYRVRIDPAGAIQFSTAAVQIISQYNFALRRVAGFALNPAGLGSAPALIGFNIKEEGRNFTVFKRPISMASILATSGAGNLAEWDGVYICVPGTQVLVDWSVDTQRWPILVGATIEVGVQLIGDYVVCGR